MQVEGLLRAKGDRVATVSSTATVAEVVAELTFHGVGALVVSGDGSQVDGIVSERDVVRALAEHGPELLSSDVTSIMTRDVITCDMRTTVDELSKLMTEGRMRHVPVLVDGGLAGIVSIGDVVKDQIRDLEVERAALHEYISQGR